MRQCIQCNNEIASRTFVEGEWRQSHQRKRCFDCLPLNGLIVTRPKCKLCNIEIPRTTEIKGKIVWLGRRKYCLDCLPFDGSLPRNKFCEICNEPMPAYVEINGKKKAMWRRKRCVKCFPLKELGVNRTYKCFSCGITYEKHGSGATRIRCSSCAIKLLRKLRKQKLVDMHGGCCQICGYNKCLGAMQFHHLNPKNKLFGIGDTMNESFDSYKEESKKCVLLCVRCHFEVELRHIQIEKILANNEFYKLAIEYNNLCGVSYIRIQGEI